MEFEDTSTRDLHFGEFDTHSMAEILIFFLSNLSSPIVPTTMFPSIEVNSQNIQYLTKKFLEELPLMHYNVCIHNLFFRECLGHKERNMLSVAKLARICCNFLAIGTQGANYLHDTSASIQRRRGYANYHDALFRDYFDLVSR